MVRQDKTSEKNELFQMSKLVIIDGSQNRSKLSMEESSPCCAAASSDTWSERSLKRIFFRLLLLASLQLDVTTKLLLTADKPGPYVHLLSPALSTFSSRLHQTFSEDYSCLYKPLVQNGATYNQDYSLVSKWALVARSYVQNAPKCCTTLCVHTRPVHKNLFLEFPNMPCSFVVYVDR